MGNRSNKSSQSKAQSLGRKLTQAKRGSSKFSSGSNPHLGAARSQSGQPKKG